MNMGESSSGGEHSEDSGSMPAFRISRTLFTVETGAGASFSFDLSGCLVRAAWDDKMARWGLDGGALLKRLGDHPGEVVAQHLLNPSAGLVLGEAACSRAQALLARGPALPTPPWDTVAAQVAAAGIAATAHRASQFAKIYSAVGILPPDQYGALVLQLTTGCRWNRCTFCSFYRNQSFRIKTADEFAQHIIAVLAMLGRALNRRSGIFLGDAGALSLSIEHSVAMCDVINRMMPPLERSELRRPEADPAVSGGEAGRWPIYAFMDVFSTGPRRASEFALLAERGLRRIYLGAETGSDALLRLLRKPATADMLLTVAQAIKAGGVGVGPVFMLGVGGRQYAAEHAAATAALLAEMPLDSADTVFFSVLQPAPGSTYAAWAQSNNISPLTTEELKTQEQEIRHGLQPYAAGGPKVTGYDVSEFVYY